MRVDFSKVKYLPPTARQEAYAIKIARYLGLELPAKKTFENYRAFIQENAPYYEMLETELEQAIDDYLFDF